MSLRARVFLGLGGLLALTLVAAWLLAGGTVLRRLIGNLEMERVDIALYLAEEVEAAADPAARAAELARALRVQADLSERKRWGMVRRGREVERRGRTVVVLPGNKTPILVPVDGAHFDGTLVVRFPVDLDAPPRKVRLGLVILGAVALLAAAGVSRWVLRPLDVASEAMRRVAEGDLDHRAPTGSDAAGQIGATFNLMADRVRAMVRGQRELMAAVSHELRTPLSRLRLQAELLADEGARPERVAAVERDVAEMNELVEELLESARLDQGVIALQRAPTDLGELCAEALGAVDLGDHPISLSVPEGLVAPLDRKRLLRAVTNLLSNVARYTPPDTAVEIAATADLARGGRLRLEVADRGHGVPPGALPRLFEPFYRAEGSRSRLTGGLGLGLMLVRQVVEAHGGTVGAENRDGGGLRVWMELPLSAGP